MSVEDDMTLGEIGRSVTRIERVVEAMNNDLEKTYVRQDVWQRAELGAGQRVGELEKDIADLRQQHVADVGDIRRDFASYKADQRSQVQSRVEKLIYPVCTGITLAVVLSLLNIAK